jgi:hypothetical protein
MKMKDLEPSRKEISFKIVGKEEKLFSMKDMDESITTENDETNEEDANFIRRLQRGSRKYKGKFPFKFF